MQIKSALLWNDYKILPDWIQTPLQRKIKETRMESASGSSCQLSFDGSYTLWFVKKSKKK